MAWNNVEVESEDDFHVEPICILDNKEVVLQNKTIKQLKFQWKNYAPKEATWEREDVMKQAYPFLFQDFDRTE